MRTVGMLRRSRRRMFLSALASRRSLKVRLLTCGTVLCELVALVAVPACGGIGADGGSGGSEPDVVQTESAPLTLGNVLPGKIVPATGVVQSSGQKQIVGTTRGEANVNAFGAATYDVPIWVPDGVRGMQPRISIAYRSNGDVGLLGPKWNISGLGVSVIRRCRKTIAHDGITRPMDLQNGDEYCLDGERLIRVSGSPNGPGEFRTRVNPFAKIVASAASGTGGLSFRVFEPNGLISDYGRTEASRLWGNPILFPDPGIPGNFLPRQVAAYYVDKIQDRFGNSILITYANQPTGPVGQPIATQSPDELVPSLIQWGGVGDTPGQRSIQFGYQAPTGGHNFGHQRFLGGLGVYLGQGLTSLRISGPDGVGNVPVLKVYNFSYSSPTITGETLLSQISECDGNNVCKRPTTVTWEQGSMQYDSGVSLPGFTDVLLPGYSVPILGGGFNGPTLGPNTYRRILVADLNNDGRDDIVYRGMAPAVSNGSGGKANPPNTCLVWFARLAQPGGTFGGAINLNVGADTDLRCNDPTWTGGALPGEITITDINRDGFPDIISPVQENFDVRITTLQKSYTLYLNTAAGGNTVAFTGRIPFEAPVDALCDPATCNHTAAVDGRNPQIAVGDLDGDGAPEIVRPQYPAGAQGRLWSVGFPSCGLSGSCGPASYSPVVQGIPDVNQAITGFSVLDVDGDGIAEVLRDRTDLVTTIVSSPTMSGTLTLPQTNVPYMTPKTATPPSVRFVLDLNGDGLKDLATIYSTDTSTIWTQLNNGKGFDVAVSQSLPPAMQVGGVDIPSATIGSGWQSGFDSGVRVVDYNLDGRDDLLLVDADPSTTAGQGNGRASQTVLLSDGTGMFNPYATTTPIGDAADGWSWFQPVAGSHGYRTSVVLDYNGDGLPDLLQIEGGVPKLYTRQGRVPDMVTGIAEGTGRALSMQYAPVTDSTVYTPDFDTCNEDPTHLVCLTGGRLVTSALTESGDTRLSSRMFTYLGGMYDRGGLGFVGFEQIDTKGPHSKYVRASYDLTRATAPFPGYTYPNVGRPSFVWSQLDTPGSFGRIVTTRSFQYTTGEIMFDPRTLVGASFNVLPTKFIEQTLNCASAGVGVVGCSGRPALLSGKTQTFTVDAALGNILTLETDDDVQSEIVTNTYYPPDVNNWLTGVVNQTKVTSSTPATGQSVTRTTNFTPEPAVNGASGVLTGETRTMELEPGADTSVHLMRTFVHDTRGRVTSMSEADFPTAGECSPQCSGQCTPGCSNGCAGAGANTGQCIAACMGPCMANCMSSCQSTPHTDARTTAYQYEDADGVYVTTTTDAMSNTTRVWRHVGLGLIVETDDENQAATTYTYDSLGRPLSQRAPSGESMTAGYDDTTAASFLGANVKLLPGGSSQRGVSVHLDPFANATIQTSSVTSTRTLTKKTTYDDLGRPFQVDMLSKTGPALRTLNTEIVTLDDANRVVSDCHLTSSDGQNHCKTNTYNGFTITSVNEAGRTVTTLIDSRGRVGLQQTSLASGTSWATFVYGPFDLLQHEEVEDGSGSTDITYDVRGRPRSVTRTNAGVRGTTYNAFGDVTTTYKVDSLSAPHEIVTYGRDKLGRIKTTTSPGAGTGTGIPPAINRQYFWDVPKSTGAFPRGKLNDVVDSGNQTSLHFEYNAAGLLSQKSLTVFNPSLGASGANETYTASMSYDTQGRLDTLTYPKVPTETQAFAAKYAYDSFTGTPSSIKDANNLSTTIWTPTARNELGEITNETLALGTTTLTRVTSYFLQDGRLKSASIGTSTSRSQLDYTYQADGLPLTLALSGVGGSSTSTFANDNLGRLISWTPGSGAPAVTYGYDSDGNLLSRTWSGETVTYGTALSGATMTARTVTTQRGTAAAQTDTYQVDAFGRVSDTPAVSIRMTDDSRVGSITEKANGQIDTLIYDGLGARVLTRYGSRGSAGSLLEIGDLFELKRDGTNSTAGTVGRCRLRSGDRLVGDIVRSGTAARTATFYLEDGVHSVLAEVSSGGTVTARKRRDPFGNSFTSSTQPFLPSDPSAANPDGSSRLGFGSHNRDQSWGLVDMVARAYSPRLGRFISPDLIIGNPQDRREFNPFAYVQNNPTSKYDPLGLDGGGVGSGPPPGGGGPPGGPGPDGVSTGGGGSTGGGTGGRDGGAQDAPTGASGAPFEQSPTGTPGGPGAAAASREAATQSGRGGAYHEASDAEMAYTYIGSAAGRGMIGDGFGQYGLADANRAAAAQSLGAGANNQNADGGAGGVAGSAPGGNGTGHGGESGSHAGGDYSGGYASAPYGGAGGAGGSGGWSGGISGAGGYAGAGGMQGAVAMRNGAGGQGGGTGRGTWGGPFNESGVHSNWSPPDPTGGGMVGFSATGFMGVAGLTGGAYIMIDNNSGLSIQLTYAELNGLGTGLGVGSSFGLFSGPPEGQGGGSRAVCAEGPGGSVGISQSTGAPFGSAFTVGVSSPTIAGVMVGQGHTAIITVLLSTFD